MAYDCRTAEEVGAQDGIEIGMASAGGRGFCGSGKYLGLRLGVRTASIAKNHSSGHKTPRQMRPWNPRFRKARNLGHPAVPSISGSVASGASGGAVAGINFCRRCNHFFAGECRQLSFNHRLVNESSPSLITEDISRRAHHRCPISLWGCSYHAD